MTGDLMAALKASMEAARRNRGELSMEREFLGLRAGGTADRWGRSHWRYRHAGGCADDATRVPVCAVKAAADDVRRCRCRNGPHQCCERVNDEDRCEPCRKWCDVAEGGTDG